MPPKKTKKSEDPDYIPRRTQINPSTPAKTRKQGVAESQFFVDTPKVTVGQTAFSGAFSGATAAFTEAKAIAKNIGETVHTAHREISDLEEEKVKPKMPGGGDDEVALGGVPNPGAPLPGAPLPGAPPVVPELDPQVKAYVAEMATALKEVGTATRVNNLELLSILPSFGIPEDDDKTKWITESSREFLDAIQKATEGEDYNEEGKIRTLRKKLMGNSIKHFDEFDGTTFAEAKEHMLKGYPDNVDYSTVMTKINNC